MTVTVHHGDSRDVLKSLADASIDSVVCDPPYALVSIGKRFGADDAAPAKGGKSGAYARASAGFMGQKWDTGETAFAVEFWAEVSRVLKPGGHVIAFSATRTYHRLACAIEDAGFEIRDMVAWLYGSGFPKSHSVSKGVDKLERGSLARAKLLHFAQERGVDGAWLEGRGVASAASFRDWTIGGHVPSDANWRIISAALEITPEQEADFERSILDRASNGVAGGTGRHAGLERAYGFKGDFNITAAATEAARQWEGWGTALKPALEPVVFARKPLDGTVAANVLAHGMGALNIDSARVIYDPDDTNPATNPLHRKAGGYANGNAPDRGSSSFSLKDGSGERNPSALGRWPANVIHDGSDEVVEAFPQAPGQQRDIDHDAPSAKTSAVYGKMNRVGEASATRRYADRGSTDFAPLPGQRRGDTGSAARFFYSAKADAEDRLGSKHPTVKPIDLMAYLCRLVTPPGGTILDPFAGTGTTGLGAMRGGFNAILIEREAEYVADIHRRIAWATGAGRLTAQEKSRSPAKPLDELPLFGGEAA